MDGVELGGSVMKARIDISKNIHGTADVVVYCDEKGAFDWFRFLDVWGSAGYDRFDDGGIYFEINADVARNIPNMAFVRHCGAEVVFDWGDGD